MTKPENEAVPKYVHKAQERKLLAEARRSEAMALGDEISNRVASMQMDKIQLGNEYEEAHDARHRIYRFDKPFTPAECAKAADTLTRWSRMDEARGDKPGPIEIVIYSPGGSLTDGMMLFDTIKMLRRKGHRIDTTAVSVAASMGSILLQAGETRRMTKETWLLIHNLSGGVVGSLGDLEDTVDWIKRVSERTLDIFAARCKKSKAPKKLTRAEIKRNIARTDWWISSEDCLAFGLVDEVL